MCFDAGMLFQLAILVVIVLAAIAIVKLVLPNLGVTLGGTAGQIISILIWAVVVIMAIVFIWKIAACSGLLRL